MAKRGFLMSAERATAKRLRRLGGMAIVQFERAVDAAVRTAKGTAGGAKTATAAIAAAQRRVDDIASGLDQLRKELAKRGVTSRRPARKARRKTVRKAARKPARKRAVRRKKRL